MENRLSVDLNSKMSLEKHVTNMYRKVNYKSHALIKVVK